MTRRCHDAIDGSASYDFIGAGNCNDQIFDGGNRVDDGLGNDTPYVGGGNDTLLDGTGFDVFVFDMSLDHGNDATTNFLRGTDALQMSGVTYGNLDFFAIGFGVRIE